MANEEHREILRRGVEEWNAWREEHPEIRSDLRGADLKDAHLVGAYFTDAILQSARLDGANLDRATLVGTNLASARLGGANLRGAHLVDADLKHAYFEGAHFDGAFLLGARLHDANLRGACLDGAALRWARLDNTRLDGARLNGAGLGRTAIVTVDLSRTDGLETVQHAGPSGIATSTLELTAAGLAKDPSRQSEIETFLRAAGVEDHWIDYFRSRIGQPIEFYSCFISYSHEDKSFARRICRPTGSRHPLLARRAPDAARR